MIADLPGNRPADRPEPGEDPDTVDPFNELAAIAALERRRTEEPIRARRELTDQVITLLDEDAERPEIPILLRQLGLDLTRPTVAVVAQAIGSTTPLGLVGSLLGEAVSHLSTPVVGSDAQGLAVALVSMPGAGPDSDQENPAGTAGSIAADTVRRALLRLRTGAARDPAGRRRQPAHRTGRAGRGPTSRPLRPVAGLRPAR